MAFTMVTMVTEKLIDVSQTFLRLNPEDISNLLFTRIPEIAHAIASTLTLNKYPWAMDIAKNAIPHSGPCFQNCTNPLSLNISPGLLCSYKRMLIDLLI